MTAEQLRVLVARAYSDKLSIDNTVTYLRANPKGGAKLTADYEDVQRGLASILEDLDEMIAAQEAHHV